MCEFLCETMEGVTQKYVHIIHTIQYSTTLCNVSELLRLQYEEKFDCLVTKSDKVVKQG